MGGSRTEELLVVGLNPDLCTGNSWHAMQMLWKTEFPPVKRALSKRSGSVSQRSINHLNRTTNVSKATSSFTGPNYNSNSNKNNGGESSRKKARP
tara:strand:- start:19 stop:303 length:285 start_codon:yes stop_codon:yes gene_type:complete